MVNSFLLKLREAIERVAPSAETVAQREAGAFQAARCGLLMEVARLDSPNIDRKREAVAVAMRERFSLRETELARVIADAQRSENRLTSYFEPVALLNRRLSPAEKVTFIEQLWRVALADGDIDAYEDDLVSKLADLLYVEHADFILAKHRVLEKTQTKGA